MDNVFYYDNYCKLFCGDCVELIKEIQDETIDLIITSPPYDNLRDYGGFFFDYKKIIPELYRVLKNGRVVVWVVADQTINGSETGNSFRQALFFMDCGFKLYDTMIYLKNSFSRPEKNRYHQCFEYMFIFLKGEKISVFNPLKDRINKTYNFKRNYFYVREKDGSIRKKKKNYIIPKYGMRFNVWEYNIGYRHSSKDKIAFEHPAIFPEKLALDHLLSWSNEGDLILDPFAGSGTVLKKAKEFKRFSIGFEICKNYCEIIKTRLLNTTVNIF